MLGSLTYYFQTSGDGINRFTGEKKGSNAKYKDLVELQSAMLFNVRGFESAVVERVEVIDADDVAPVSKETVECVASRKTLRARDLFCCR